MFNGDQAPATKGRWVEITNDEYTTVSEYATGFPKHGIDIRHVMEGINDQDRTDALSPEWKPTGIAKNRSQPIGPGLPCHARGGIKNDPLSEIQPSDSAPGAAADIHSATNVSVSHRKARTEFARPCRWHHQIVQGCEPIERTDITVHTGRWDADRIPVPTHRPVHTRPMAMTHHLWSSCCLGGQRTSIRFGLTIGSSLMRGNSS
jgi:hypothetical protein